MKLYEIFQGRGPNNNAEVIVFRYKDTGIQGDIYVSVGEAYGRKIKHGPRVKFYPNGYQNDGGNKSYTININPVLMNENLAPFIDGKTDKQVKQWIRQHYTALIQYWNGLINTEELLQHIKNS